MQEHTTHTRRDARTPAIAPREDAPGIPRIAGRRLVSIAATEQFEYQESNDGGEQGGGEGGGEGGGGDGWGHPQPRQPPQQGRAKKAAKVVPYTLVDVPPALQRELDAFTEWRLKPINRDRQGVSVEPITVAGNRADALRLLGWLKTERNVVPTLCGVFGSDRLGAAVQAFIIHLRARGRTYSTCAGYAKSFIAIARFVHAMRTARASQGVVVSSKYVDDMRRAHQQTMHQARQEQKFAAAKPKAWLDWSQVLAARCKAMREYERHKADEDGGHLQRKRLFDATLLTWLSSVPPDRVSVSRKLQLGVTLKPTSTGFDLDLSTPDAHKTAAIFGPTVTPVPEVACKMLRTWMAVEKLGSAGSTPFVFVLGDGRRGTIDHSQPVGDKRWTKVVQAVLQRHAGVPVAPKDLRSSFITFLMSDDHADSQLKNAVAFAMRHSTQQQASPAYDKERSERLWAAAVKVAAEYAGRLDA